MKRPYKTTQSQRDAAKRYREKYPDRVRKWRDEHPRNTTIWEHKKGHKRPMSENKCCASFLGVHVAEQALRDYFEDMKQMPVGNPGYDFVCKNGYKIDVKSSVLHKGHGSPMHWAFTIRKNAIADYFFCIGFDDRENLNPLHAWLIPGGKINHLKRFEIVNTTQSIRRWIDYEKPLDKIISACATIIAHRPKQINPHSSTIELCQKY